MNPVPHAIEDEQSLIGAVLNNPKLFYQASESLEVGDFHHPLTAKAFSLMLQSENNINLLRLTSELKSDYPEIHKTLSEFEADSWAVKDISAQIQSIKGMSASRMLVDKLTEALKYAYRAMPERARDIAIDASSNCMTHQENTLVHISKNTKAVVQDWSTALDGCDSVIGKTTSFWCLDNFFRLSKASMVVIGARPSIGKTALGLNIALGSCATGAKGIFFSAEMATKSLTERAICTIGMVDGSKMRSGQTPTAVDLANMTDGSKYIDQLGLDVDDRAGMTVEYICAKTRAEVARKKVDFIIVDYWQFLTNSDRKMGVVEGLDHSSRMLKNLGKETGVCVVVLAQLRRTPDKDNHRPNLGSFKGSSSIEQDADTCVLLHRERDETKDADTRNMIEIEAIIEKNRSGPIGSVKMGYIPAYTKFLGSANE